MSERASETEQAVLQALEPLGECTMEDLIRHLPDYSWNQIFTSVDQLSRDGTLKVNYSSRVDQYLISAPQGKTG